MKTEHEETITRKYFIIKCDFCEVIQRDAYFRQCCICGKDICNKHSSYFYETPSDDYSTHVACPDHKNIVQKKYDEYDEVVNDMDMPDINEMIKDLKGV